MGANLAAIAAPKFNWDQGLKQSDQLVQNIQRGKLSIADFWKTFKTGSQEIATQQARLARATAVAGPNGSALMAIPSKKEVLDSASAIELASRKMAAQREILSGLSTKVVDWGKNVQWAGRQITVGFTMPFAMAMAAAGSYANKIDQDLVNIKKVYDGNMQEIDGLAKDTAASITRTMGQSADSTLKVMAALAAAGKTGEDLRQVTYESQKLATLGNVDQEQSIKGVIAMQSIWQMSNKELTDSINFLNEVDSKTPTGIKDLIDAIPIAGVQVKQLGGTIQDTTILLAAFKERGIETVEGANAIKTAMNRIIAPTAAAKDLFQKLTGQSLEALVKATGGKPLETLQAIADAIHAGNIGLADQQKLITKLVGIYQSSRITGLLTGLNESNGAVAKAKEAAAEGAAAWQASTETRLKQITQSASGQFKIAVESFKTEMQDFGTVALKAGTYLLGVAKGFLGMFNSLPDIIKRPALIGAGIIAIAGPLTMITGLAGNLFGTFMKFGLAVTTLFAKVRGKNGFGTMTVEAKALELEQKALSGAMLTQSEQTQLLVIQQGQLAAAYLESASAARTLAMAMNVPGSDWAKFLPDTYWNTKVQGKQATGNLDTLIAQGDWARKTQGFINGTEKGITQVTQEEKKMVAEQGNFGQKVLGSVGAVTMLGSVVTDTGSGLNKWLTYISMFSLATTALLPLLGKVAEVVKTSSLASAFGNLTSGAGGVVSKVGASIKSGIGTAIGAVLSPAGLGIAAAAGATLLGVKLLVDQINKASEQQKKQSEDIVHSTDMWSAALGKTKAVWGQVRTESGKVQDTVQSLAKALQDNQPDLVNIFKNVSGDKLLSTSLDQALRLKGSFGMNKVEVENNLRAVLTAAGKTKKEIEDIIGQIDVRFDFAGGIKDLDVFVGQAKNRFNELKDTFANPDNYSVVHGVTSQVSPMDAARGVKPYESINVNSDRIKETLRQKNEEFSKQFTESLAGMDENERYVFAKTFSDNMAKNFTAGLDELNKKYGGTLGKDAAAIRERFFNYDPKQGRMVLDQQQASYAHLSDKDIASLTGYVDEEQNLAKAIAKSMGATDEQLKQVTVIGDVMKFAGGNIRNARDAQNLYNKTIADAAKNGYTMSDAEKSKLAAVIASATGVDAAKLKTNEYSKSILDNNSALAQNKQEIIDFLQTLNNGKDVVAGFWDSVASPDVGFDSLGGDPTQQASQLTDQVKGIYSGAMDTVYDALAAQAEEKWQQRLDAITQSFETRKNAIQKQIQSVDKAYDDKAQKFEDDFNDKMDKTKDAYEKRQKSIEDGYDAQIKKIKDQEDAEDELDKQRERQFQAEQKRIERLTALANNNIDFNKALAGGSLDEAARIMNNTEALQAGYSAEDAQDAASQASEQRKKQHDAAIDRLEAQKQAALDNLKAQEDALEKSMQKQHEIQKRAMEDARDIEKQRLQNTLDSLSQQQAAAENKERKVQEQQKRSLEIQLQTLRAFIPQNQAELSAHIKKVADAYGQFGLNLQTTGGYWGTIIGNALTNNVDRARAEMSNNARWSAFANSVSNQITKGAFNMNLNDFFNMIATGTPPKNWKPPGASKPISAGLQFGSIKARHAGGPVDNSAGSRNGRGDSNLGPDEDLYILQKGEFVFPKFAVDRYGSTNLQNMINTTQPESPSTNGMLGIAGIFGGALGGMWRPMLNMGMDIIARNAAAANTNIAQVLGYGGAGTYEALNWARQQAGKPYIWGATGPVGYDCSGFMSAITAFLEGLPTTKRLFSTASFQPGKGVAGFVPGLNAGDFQIGVRHGNPGHMAGTLGGINVESTGDHVRVGGDAHGATDPQFTMQFSLPDAVRSALFQPMIGSITPELAGGIQAIVRKVADTYGWGAGPEWDSLAWLIQHESSWNATAQNPTSTAYGLFQFLNSTWAGTGIPKTSDPRLQAIAGLRYISSRYHDPIGARAFWEGHRWYESGGYLQPGFTMAYNGTNKPETILNSRGETEIISMLHKTQLSYDSFNDAIRVMDRTTLPKVATGATAAVTNHNQYNITIQGSGLSQKELEQAIYNAIDKKDMKDKKKRGVIR